MQYQGRKINIFLKIVNMDCKNISQIFAENIKERKLEKVRV